MTPLLLLAAVVAGWGVQGYLSLRQSQAFRRQTANLRTLGTVTVGAGGRRYRGGRAFVALAVDPSGRVKAALVLRGWTTFARPRPCTGVVGQRVTKLAGPAEIPGLDRTQREASRQAAELLVQSRAVAAARATRTTTPATAEEGITTS